MTTPSLSKHMRDQRVSNLGLDPFPWYKQMRMTNPISVDEQNQVYGVFRYKDVQSVLSNPTLFSSERLEGRLENEARVRGSIMFMDPPRHKRLRSLFSQAFTPRAVTQQTEHIRDVVNELLDASMASGTLEVIEDLALRLPVRLITEMLGVPRSLQANFKQWCHAITGPSLVQAAASFEELEETVRTLVVERRKERQPDLISALLAAEEDGEPVSEQEIVDFCVVLLTASHDTTVNLIGNMILCLDEYPSAREQIWEDPSLVPSTIEEVLRFRSVLQRGSRRVTRDTQLGGKPLKAGYNLFYWSGSANRDEEYFPDPDVFDIRRSPNRHLGFGYGIHFCLGAQHARLTAKIVLEQMIERFKDIQRIREVPLQPVTTYFAYGVQQLPVRLYKK
jgi:cytochrome P450